MARIAQGGRSIDHDMIVGGLRVQHGSGFVTVSMNGEYAHTGLSKSVRFLEGCSGRSEVILCAGIAIYINEGVSEATEVLK